MTARQSSAPESDSLNPHGLRRIVPTACLENHLQFAATCRGLGAPIIMRVVAAGRPHRTFIGLHSSQMHS
jgi:hypothetical protein